MSVSPDFRSYRLRQEQKCIEDVTVNSNHKDLVPFKIDLELYDICIKFKMKIAKTKSCWKQVLWWLNNVDFNIHAEGFGSPKKADGTLF